MNQDFSQTFAYEIVNGGAVIWRCFSRTSKAVIPEEIGEYPVTAIAPYAFSAHMDEKMLVGKTCTLNNIRLEEIELPQLCGNQLEEVEIPPTVKRVGRYCFYNCKNLHRITFTDTLKDWGSGTFTGCHAVRELEVTMYKEETSTLKDVLMEVPEPLVVDYQYKNAENGYKVKLVFPEYFEEGVENTPARIISTEVHGSGLRFRNCFQKRKLNFLEYDSKFAYAQAQENFELVVLMAEYRLRYPHELTDEYRSVYEAYLVEHRREYGKYLIDRKEMESLIWFSNMLSDKTSSGNSGAAKIISKEAFLEWLNQMIDYAAKKQYQEAVSFLMDCRYRCQPSAAKKKKSFDFDL